MNKKGLLIFLPIILIGVIILIFSSNKELTEEEKNMEYTAMDFVDHLETVVGLNAINNDLDFTYFDKTYTKNSEYVISCSVIDFPETCIEPIDYSITVENGVVKNAKIIFDNRVAYYDSNNTEVVTLKKR